MKNPKRATFTLQNSAKLNILDKVISLDRYLQYSIRQKSSRETDCSDKDNI